MLIPNTRRSFILKLINIIFNMKDADETKDIFRQIQHKKMGGLISGQGQ